MQRYLLNVSYIGTQFCGASKSFPTPTFSSIQGCLELACQKLRPQNEIKVICSSRTDTGVHALHTTFHVDLQRRSVDVYKADYITTSFNKFFGSENLQIRVINTLMVPNTFHCRYHAKFRNYLYRFAVLKDKELAHNCYGKFQLFNIPIEEYNRCYFICDPNFDINKFKEALLLFEGVHDFRTFMGRGSHYPDKITRRNLEVCLKAGNTAAIVGNYTGQFTNLYDFYNISFKSSGFLYNQVRRIVGTLFATGQGKLSTSDIKFMLQVPSHLSWNNRVRPAPSYGLYLCQVGYSSIDLV